ncbi:MAG: PEP-CTERM sorting domain-containing protein [Chthoniobacteraceae bacterium]
MKTQIVIAIAILAFTEASSRSANLLLNSGFESNTGNLPNSWTYLAGPDGPATLQGTPSSPFININPFGAASILMTDGATTTVTPNLLQSFTTQTSGILNVAWDFRLNTKTGSPWAVQIDDAVTAQTKFNMDSAGNFVVENPLGATTTIMALAANTWYQVQLALDMTNKTLSGSITSQGLVTTPIGSQQWRVTAGSSSINRVLILDDTLTAAAAGNMLIDNFAVDRTAFAAPTIVPEPSAMLFLGIGGLLAGVRRRRQ